MSLNKRRFRRPGSRRSGFTLIETMMAMFVVVVGLLPMLGLFLSARALDQQAQAQAAAYSVARQEVESLAAQKFANRPVSTGAFAVPDAIVAQFPGLNMTGSYVITTVSGYGGAAYPVQQIAAQVQWANNVGPTHGAGAALSSVRVDTLITQEPNK